MDADRVIVYGTIAFSGDGHLTFLREEDAHQFRQTIHAMDVALTWGDFWALLPERDRRQVQEDFTLNGDCLPPDIEEFDPQGVPGVADGDFPPAGHICGGDWVPRELKHQYGVERGSMVAGIWFEYPRENEAAMVAALRGMGYDVRRDDELVGGATGCQLC